MIYTTQQANSLVFKLSQVVDKMYSTKSVLKTLESYLDEQEINYILELNNLKTHPFKDAKQVSHIISESINKIKSAETVTIVISFEPSTTFEKQIYSMLSENLEKSKVRFYLDFVFDQSYFSGCALEYKGKIFEHTYIKNG